MSAEATSMNQSTATSLEAPQVLEGGRVAMLAFLLLSALRKGRTARTVQQAF